MVNIFKNNYTRWVPLGQFSWAGECQYIVFVRGNIKTGMLYFKTKRVNRLISRCVHPVLPATLINTSEQWEKILNEINNARACRK